ncbi:hypothetical protein QP572_00795 [Brevibacterium sp. UMB10442]|nr:hypothetical protein [Brevibacterium sp. UMB10442]
MSDVIARMLANRRLERVAVNRDYAVTVIEMAKQHVRTAEALAGSDDQAMAFTVAVDTALEEFEWMRQVRNATEYPSDDQPTATLQDVREAISAASAIVTACEVNLG